MAWIGRIWASRWIVALSALIALFALTASSGRVSAVAPTLTVDPDHGPCSAQVIAREQGFAPGEQLTIVAGRVGPVPSHVSAEVATLVVPADGARIRVTVSRRDPRLGGPLPGPGNLLAEAFFVAVGTPSGLPNTGGGAASRLENPVGPVLALGLLGAGLAAWYRRRYPRAP